MADLRDQTFIPSSDNSEILAASPMIDREPVVISEPIAEPVSVRSESPEEGIGLYHVNDDDEGTGSNTAKIVGGIAVALLVGAAVVYGYEVSTNKPTQAMMTQTAANNPPPARAPMALPATVTPQPQQSAMAPAPAPEAQATAVDTAPAPAHKSHAVRSARQERAAPVNDTVLPVTPVEPVSPTPPASSLAANPETQPVQSAPAVEPAVPAAPVEAAPAAEPAAAAAAPAAPDQAAQPAPVTPAPVLPTPDQSAPAQQQ
jgi:hypothetical protein